jgi:metal-responsive CopG/Arc/MetJ family transcriptional regulator
VKIRLVPEIIQELDGFVQAWGIPRSEVFEKLIRDRVSQQAREDVGQNSEGDR